MVNDRDSELKKLTLLCVEDETDVREWFAKAFSRMAGRVLTAKDGQEGLAIFEKEAPDVIFSDIMMPKMNGLMMASEIRKRNPDVQIVIMTAYGETEYLIDAIEVGVNGFVFKPLDLARLQDLFRKCGEVALLRQQVEQKRNELLELVYNDFLTKLPNRMRLLSDLETSKTPFLMLLNIDSFKEINDFYGHYIGDFVLSELGNRITHLMAHEGARFYKLSADEFAILLDLSIVEPLKEVEILSFVESVNNEIFMYEDYEISISVTVGISTEMENTLAKADMALKEAKRGHKPFVIYDHSMKILEQYSNNIIWTKKLKCAIEANRIIPYFQPIVDNSTKKTTKYECLVRMINEQGRIESPASFLEISKKSRLYPKITKAMIVKTFEKFDGNSREFSINLSVDDIMDPHTAQLLYDTIDATKGRCYPVFEILESEGIENYAEVKKFITRVKDSGCKIAIDDFGTGYSNFEHIMRLSVDYLKIDASLIRNIHNDINSQLVVDTIVGFANRLAIKTIAEYVHCVEVYDKVNEIGVDMSQGYYFSEPLSFI